MAGRKWQQDEIDFIKQNYKTMTCGQMSIHINRTERAVEHMSANLHLIREAQIEDKFGRLTIKSKFTEEKYGQIVTFVNCTCDCGNNHTLRLSSLVTGHTESCGCLRDEKARERVIQRNWKHGEADLKNNRLYRIWSAMKSRCYTIYSSSYKDYGGRGIKICDEWKDSFEKFYEDMSPTYVKGLSIEREDVNGHYEKTNCLWVTRSEQANNRRTTIYMDTEIGVMKIKDAAKLVGICWQAMYTRYKHWPKERWLEPK